jgi:GDP-L-fucose synthase
MLSKDARILVTGGTGLIGTNLTRRLESLGYQTWSIGSERDLREAAVCEEVFANVRPDVVFHLAAKVGGILANSTYKADFYFDNVMINTNVVNACATTGVAYIFAMGTGCAYPKRLEAQKLYEADFLDGTPEVTNDAYAYAKRGLLVHLQALQESGGPKFSYCLPSNIYGPHDNFHPKHSHVVPGLIRRFCDAQDEGDPVMNVWGNGSARRDFLHIDDCIDAIMTLAASGAEGVYNVSTGHLTSIRELAGLVCEATGFKGEVQFDESLPAGQMQRIFDTSKMAELGWQPKVDLAAGISSTVDWFREHRQSVRER